jgi:pimeloyl-ACP methyl ester carboxylesterase
MKRKTTQAYGLETRFFEAGDRGAPTLVLVHGGEPGQHPAADTWRYNVEGLGEHVHVLAPDRAGAGYTENFVSEEQLRIGEICNHLAAFLDERGVRDAVLTGQSRGAFVVLEVARWRPDLVAGLVLTNSASIAPRYPAWKHREDFGDMLGGPENIRHDLEWLTTVHDNFTDSYVSEVREMLSSPGQIEARRMHASVAAEYFEDFEATKQEQLAWLREGGYAKPVLMLWGVDDPMTYVEDATEIFDLLRFGSPFARMQLIDRCGHSPFAEYPAEFNELVARFVTTMR